MFLVSAVAECVIGAVTVRWFLVPPRYLRDRAAAVWLSKFAAVVFWVSQAPI